MKLWLVANPAAGSGSGWLAFSPADVFGTTPVKMECLHHCLEVFA